MVVINVDGKDYEINENQENLMEYVKEAKAIEQGGIKINTIDQKTFEFILKILQDTNYVIKDIPRVATNVVEDVIGKDLDALIGKLDAKELNNLYRAVHYLKIKNLKKSISAVMACRIYLKPDLKDYNTKKEDLGLKNQMTTEESKNYKERFPWMN